MYHELRVSTVLVTTTTTNDDDDDDTQHCHVVFQVCVVCSVMVLCVSVGITQSSEVVQEPPEGYYAFVESPNAEPPRVRRPPYQHSDKECPGLCLSQRCVLGPQSVKSGEQY